jgi:hypothetical protein
MNMKFPFAIFVKMYGPARQAQFSLETTSELIFPGQSLPLKLAQFLLEFL